MDRKIADGIERVEVATDFIRNRLAGIQKILFKKNALDAANNELTNVFNELNQYVANKNVGHLQTFASSLREDLESRMAVSSLDAVA